MNQPNLSQRLAERLEFDDETDGRAIVKGAGQSAAEYFEPKTAFTVWDAKEVCYEHGFYAGALYQRNRYAPIHAALVECVAAAEGHAERCEFAGHSLERLESALARLGEVLGDFG
jgi:hypothetical protein